MGNIFGVQPMPQASFTEFVNTNVPTPIDLSTIAKIKDSQARHQEKLDELKSREMDKQTDYLASDKNILNYTPVTEFHKQVLQNVQDAQNEYSKTLTDIMENKEASPIDYSKARLDFINKIKSPENNRAFQEMYAFKQMDDSLMSGKSEFGPDELADYKASIKSSDKPLGFIDYSQAQKMDVNAVNAGIIKANTNEQSSLERLDELGLVNLHTYDYMSVDNIKNSVIRHDNSSIAYRNKILKGYDNIDEAAEAIAEQASQGGESVGNGVFRFSKKQDLKNVNIKGSEDYLWDDEKQDWYRNPGKGTGAGKGGSGSGGAKEGVFNMAKTPNNRYDGVVALGASGADSQQNPQADIKTVKAKLASTRADLTATRSNLNRQYNQFVDQRDADGTGVVAKRDPNYPNDPTKFIKDSKGNPIDYTREYNSTMASQQENFVLINSMNQVDTEINEALVAQGLKQGTPEFEKKKEDMLVSKVQDSSYNPSTYSLDETDRDYKATITPLLQGQGISKGYEIRDAKGTILDGAKYEGKDLMFLGMVFNPFSGSYDMHFKKYDPLKTTNGNKVEVTGIPGQSYQAKTVGEDLYVRGAKQNEMMWNSLQGDLAGVVRDIQGTINSQIRAVGMAQIGPGVLDDHGFTVRKSDDRKGYEVFIKDNDGTSHSRIVAPEKLDGFLNDLAKGKLETEKQKAKDANNSNTTASASSNPQEPESAHSYFKRKKESTNTSFVSAGSSDYLWNLLVGGEGNADGTSNGKNSGQGTIGPAQFHWKDWGKAIIDGKFATSEQDFKDHPEKQRAFFNEYYVPEVINKDLAAVNKLSKSDSKFSERLNEMNNEIKSRPLLNKDGSVNQDALTYAVHNLGNGKGGIVDILSGKSKISSVKAHELEIGIPKALDKINKTALYSANDLLGSDRVTSAEGDVKILKAHIPIIKGIMDDFPELTVTDGQSYDPVHKSTGAHPRGNAYDFSLNKIENDPEKQRQIENKLKGMRGVKYAAIEKNKGKSNPNGHHIHIELEG